MAGEEYLRPDNCATAKDYNDDHCLLVCDDNDMFARSFKAPMQDRQPMDMCKL